MKTILFTYLISLNFLCVFAGDACPKPVKKGIFKSNLETIEQTDFSQTRLDLANEFVKSNCVSTKQLKEILALFNFEAHKAEVAISAYDNVVDKNKFHEIYREFSNETYIRDIQKQIK